MRACSSAAGPTVVVDQQYDNTGGRPVPDTPQRSVLIYPKRGHFAVFDGRLGHGVLGSSSREQRVTLLINWWLHKPQVSSYIPCMSDCTSGEPINHHHMVPLVVAG